MRTNGLNEEKEKLNMSENFLNDGQEFLTAKELAKRYKMAVQTFSALAKKGKFPRPIKIGRSTRWTRSMIEDFERNNASE